VTSLGDISKLVGGHVSGDPSIEIISVAALEDAKEGDLSFVLDSKNFLAAENSPAKAFVVPRDVSLGNKPFIQVDNPRHALGKILAQFAPIEAISPGIDPGAHIAKTAVIGKRTLIYPFVYIGEGCEVGEDTIIHPNVTLYPRTKIGKRCIIHSGCVIGVDGFGFSREGGKFEKIPQIGRVVVEDDVEIYANNAISRGTIGDTVIKKGTKIDNLNHIAHNVKIGGDCAVTSLNAFGGSSSLGDRVQMSAQCAVAPHVHVGSDSIIMGRTGVTKNLQNESVVLGYPAQDHVKEHKIMALVRRLPELFEKVKLLESRKKPGK
jgi:UDP-3-O-[3-hydroxymyristoyl] glucosamine N-acyltransferase